jgi:hypothetical protein
MGAFLSFVGFLTLVSTLMVLLASLGIPVVPLAHELLHYALNFLQNQLGITP